MRHEDVAGGVIDMVLAGGIDVLDVDGGIDEGGDGTDEVGAGTEDIEAGAAVAVEGKAVMELLFTGEAGIIAAIPEDAAGLHDFADRLAAVALEDSGVGDAADAVTAQVGSSASMRRISSAMRRAVHITPTLGQACPLRSTAQPYSSRIW